MKKGFTLVELLAVILVLAIIALITVPIVTNVILNAGEKSELQSAEMYIEAVNLSIMNNYLDTKFKEGTCTIIPNGYIDCEGTRIQVDADKTLPTSGTLIVEGRRVVDVQDMHLGDNIYNYSNGKLVASSAGENGGCTWGVEGDYNTIDCGGEVFYAMYTDGTNITMLSKYNLDAGYIYEYESTAYIGKGSAIALNNKYTAKPLGYTDITNQVVKQSPNAIGYNGSSTAYGVIEFAQNNYWSSGGGAIESSFTPSTNYYVKPLEDCFDGYEYVYDSNSSLYPYIESYKTYLSGLGVTVKEARLMSYEEADLIMNDYWNNGGASQESLPDTSTKYSATPLVAVFNHWISSTSYWLGSSDGDSMAVMGYGNTNIDYATYNNDYTFGIRPVLVISASQIQGTPTYDLLYPSSAIEK